MQTKNINLSNIFFRVFEGMEISYSGDGVSEYVIINRTTSSLSLYARAHDNVANDVLVEYSWQSVSPCHDPIPGCTPCENYSNILTSIIKIFSANKRSLSNV